MTQKIKNSVSAEIERLAREYGYKPSSIGSMAFKNSRKPEQLSRRDRSDARALTKLKQLEQQLEKERLAKLARLLPEGARIPSASDKAENRGAS